MSFVFCLRDCESSQENYNYLIGLGPSAEFRALNLYFTRALNVAIFISKVFDYDLVHSLNHHDLHRMYLNIHGPRINTQSFLTILFATVETMFSPF